MKILKVAISLSFLFISSISFADYVSSKKSYSILGDSKDEIYRQFEEYDKIYSTIEASDVDPVLEDDDAFIASLPKTAQEMAGESFLNFLNDKMYYSTERWHKKDILYQDDIISGSELKESGKPKDTLPPGIKAKLPFESQLSLSGRKLIGFNYTSRLYDKEEDGKRKNTSSFKMEQELQMRVVGQVGDRLSINVDYDDTVDKKDISLNYKGKPEEFIQEAAFGDITVSMPSTEFLNYSKELFGLKVNSKYKKLGLNAFFSKTKGSSEIKRFTGNTQLERKLIPDTSYIKLKYYSIKKPGINKPIKPGSVEVFIDYQKIDPKYNISISTNTELEDIRQTGFTYRGNFVLLVAGQDYTIDYNTGVLTFKNTLYSNYVVAINYQYIDGTYLNGTPMVIKDINNTNAITTEIKTYYNLGNLKIIRDNGRGNFVLQIQDLNGNIPTTIPNDPNPDNPVPVYPAGSNYDANIKVDFENGVFNLAKPLFDDLYDSNTHRYNFLTEYSYTVKILTLRPGIVPKSEKVVVDGITLTANIDYIIDYDLGILTITKDNIIKEISTVDVSYDYSMFGNESESTLIGASGRFDLTNNISIGASLLYDFTAKGGTIPDIRSTPTSLMVGEVDAKINALKIEPLNMTVNAEAEYAMSSQNHNTAGKAIIDSMDSAVHEDAASLIDEYWFHSATGSITEQRNLNELLWQSKEINIKDIDPDLEIIEGQKHIVTEIDYNVETRSELAFAYKLSDAGYDYSKKLYIDVWIKDNNAASDFIIEYASRINEDADGDGLLDTEDKNGDGILSPWEDTGQEFDNADSSISLIGAYNGKLDTEDINGNGVLDTYEDIAGSYQLSSGTEIKNYNGWKQIRIPLNITDPSAWKNIRVLRLKILQNTPERRKIVIGKIAISGNKWEKTGLGQDDFRISAIGRNDPEYRSLIYNKYYQELYDIDSSSKKDEQALKISYNTISTDQEVLAKSFYSGSTLDISKYDNLRFFVYAKKAAVGDTIVFRAGGSDTDYLEYKVPVTSHSSWSGWKLITINQTGTGRARKWTSGDTTATISVSGNPSLEKISQITVGVISSTSGTDREVWFNEIHVTGSKTLDGAAWKAGGSIQWGGSGAIGPISAGAYRKDIERDFQTIMAGIYNRDYQEDSVYFKFDGVKTRRSSILPIKAGLSKVYTYTPKLNDDESNLISVQEEGTVVNYTGYAETNLNLGASLPQVNAQYIRSIIDTSKLKQLEDKETLSGGLVYNNPIDFPLLPTNLTANASMTNSYYKVYPLEPIKNSKSFLGTDSINAYMDIQDYHTLEKAKMFSIKLPFKFSKGITFSPSYLTNNVKEKNRDFTNELQYDKSMDQTIGANFVLGIAKWFSPVITYSVSTRENYDVNSSTDILTMIIPGERKFIDRTALGEISWNLNAYDIAASPFLKTLTFSAYYRLQDSDSYDNVKKDFESTGFAMDKLWIRDNPLMEILPSYSTNTYIVKSVLNRDDIRINGRYMPFEAFAFKGMLMPLNTLSANFTYTEGSESSYITGTTKDIYTQTWPDLLIGISSIERFFGELKWMSNSQINIKYQNKDITAYGISYAKSKMYGFDYRFKLFKKLDLYFSIENTDTNEKNYNTSTKLSDALNRRFIGQGAFDLGKWRFSLRYENEEFWQTNSHGQYSGQTLKNSYLGQINSDLNFPSGIKIPIINKAIPLKNRIIFVSNLKYITCNSKVNIESDNNTNYGLSMNADYEISKYFRFLIGGSWERMEYKYNADLNYSDISLLSKLTIQF